jgi:hypothetical protein
MNRAYEFNRAQPYYVPLGNYYGPRSGEINTDHDFKGAVGVQVVPFYSGISYERPNYNSLTHGSCYNHAVAKDAYPGEVVYRARYDGPKGTYYSEIIKKNKAGPTGPSAVTKERFGIGQRPIATLAPNK